MLGKQIVFRSWNGKTYISAAPKKPKRQSPIQKENRSKFKRATMYAKNMMKDPAKKAEYKEIALKMQLPNAYTAAITDYMRNPQIEAVDLVNYSGKADEEIKVVARKKDFQLQEVEILITDDNGEVLEEGRATKGLGNEWTYRTLHNIESKKPAKIVVMAKDKAGNKVQRSF